MKSPLLVLMSVLVFALLPACREEPAEPPVAGGSTIVNPRFTGPTHHQPFAEAEPREVRLKDVADLRDGSDVFFRSDSVGEALLKVDASEWARILEAENRAPPGAVYPRVAQFVWEGEVVRDVGLSVIGRGSRVNPEIDGVLQRAQFRVDFAAVFRPHPDPPEAAPPERPQFRGRRFKDVASLILKSNDRDPSYLRSFIGSTVMAEHGVAAPRAGFTRLSLQIGDGEPKYLGLYSVQEVIDEDWLASRFGSVACVFEARKGDAGYAYLDRNDEDPPGRECDQGMIGIARAGDPVSDLPPYRPSFEYKSGFLDCAEAQEALNHFIGSLATDLDPDELERLVDVETVLRTMALGAYLGNVDDFFVYGNNAFLCLVQNGEERRWTVVPFDFDLIFNPGFLAERNPEGTLLHYGTGSVLGGRILTHPRFRARYRDILREVHRDLSSRTIEETAGRFKDIIVPHVDGYDAFDRDPYDPAEIDRMADFLIERMKRYEEEAGSR